MNQKDLVYQTIKSNQGCDTSKISLWTRLSEKQLTVTLMQLEIEGKIMMEKRRGWKVI